jgi:hypothetical protein
VGTGDDAIRIEMRAPGYAAVWRGTTYLGYISAQSAATGTPRAGRREAAKAARTRWHAYRPNRLRLPGSFGTREAAAQALAGAPR